MDVDFENLITLQKIDNELRHISAFLENIPEQIAEIDRKKEIIAKTVDNAKNKLSLNQKKRRDLEIEVKDIKAQVTKYKTQLNEVRTNREYSSLLKEIEEATKKIDNLEEEIISEMLAADETENEIREATQVYNQEEKKFQEEKEVFNRRKKELESQVKELNNQKKKLQNQIPSPQIKLYRDIAKKKNGIALSLVQDEFCSLCHMRIRPQVLNELKEKEKLIFCENCGRILYWLKTPA